MGKKHHKNVNKSLNSNKNVGNNNNNNASNNNNNNNTNSNDKLNYDNNLHQDNANNNNINNNNINNNTNNEIVRIIELKSSETKNVNYELKSFLTFTLIAIIVAIIIDRPYNWEWKNYNYVDYKDEQYLNSDKINQRMQQHTNVSIKASRTKGITQLSIKFCNEKDTIVILYWSNERADLKLLVELKPGRCESYDTYVGHVFVVNNAEQELIKAVLVQPHTVNVRITNYDTVQHMKNSVKYNDAITLPFPVAFKNTDKQKLRLYWIESGGKQWLKGEIEPNQLLIMNVFPNHLWLWKNLKNEVIKTHVMNENTKLLKSISTEEIKFRQNYFAKNGHRWINVYPRPRLYHHVHQPIRIGYKRSIQTVNYLTPVSGLQWDKMDLNLELETLSIQPKVFRIKNFLSHYEADEIIKAVESSKRFQRSTVTVQHKVISTRTSSNAWMTWSNTPVLRQIFKRGFNILGIPFDSRTCSTFAESLQVLKYDVGQEYKAHHDYFGPYEASYLMEPNIQKGNNRFATLFLYLSDVEEGGETFFAYNNSKSAQLSCEKSRKISPSKGDALLFYSMLEDGNLDESSLHGSCPVLKGVKYAANWWFWDLHR